MKCINVDIKKSSTSVSAYVEYGKRMVATYVACYAYSLLINYNFTVEIFNYLPRLTKFTK